MRSSSIFRIQDHQQHRGVDSSLCVCCSLFNGGQSFNLGHYSLGVPYHSWRITHAKHHASTGHMTQDQVFVPPTRSQIGLPPLDSAREDLLGSHVTVEVMKELREAIGDSPIGAVFGSASYLVRA